MKPIAAFLIAASTVVAGGCSFTEPGTPEPRLALFVGVDVSGSFVQSAQYDDALVFLSHYLEAHLAGAGGLERPSHLFVGPIGGKGAADAKTLFPIQTFQGRTAEEIHTKLVELFPKTRQDPFTDFNAFIAHVAETTRDRNLLLKPVSVVVLSDGIVDGPGGAKDRGPRSVDLSPLEMLSRDVTMRVLYTDPATAALWRDRVPRRRVKIWTQDAAVMAGWKDASSGPTPDPGKLFSWIADNVDYGVRARRVD